MSKRLVLMRHAKAAHPDVRDKMRPLTARGRRDAAAAGRWLAGEGVELDVALVSSAVRTTETYEHLAAGLPGAPEPTYSDELYGADVGEMVDTCQSLPDNVSSALVIGHNPTVGMLANVLDDRSGDVEGRERMHNSFPTSAMALLEIDGPWEDALASQRRLISFTVPRG